MTWYKLRKNAALSESDWCDRSRHCSTDNSSKNASHSAFSLCFWEEEDNEDEAAAAADVCGVVAAAWGVCVWVPDFWAERAESSNAL